jgi:ABC-2 type transport system permease protein
MHALIGKTRTLLSVYHALMLEYRAEVYLWALANTLPFIMMGLWVTAATRGDYGMAPEQLASYFLVVFLVRQYTTVWVIWEFEYDVLQGRLSPMLLHPLDPAWRYVAMHVGEKLARTPFAMGIVVGVLLWYPASRWSPGVLDVLLGVAGIIAAFTLRFLMQYAVAMLAFWYERAASVENLSFLPYLFLSGMVAPLELFPPVVRDVAMWTPFPYLLHFPVQLMLGQHDGLASGAAIMLGWIVAFFALQRWLWRKGLRQYASMGA